MTDTRTQPFIVKDVIPRLPWAGGVLRWPIWTSLALILSRTKASQGTRHPPFYPPYFVNQAIMFSIYKKTLGWDTVPTELTLSLK